MILAKLIDIKNKQLWVDLQKEYKIEIKFFKDGKYSCYIQNKFAIISVNCNDLNSSSFTHELLHIYIKQKGFHLGIIIKNYILLNPDLYKFFNDSLLDHLSNCLDHLKMLPLYKGLGFDDEKFLSDFNIYKCSNKELNLLKKECKLKGTKDIKVFVFFVGKLIAMLCDPNKKHDYTKIQKDFKKMDEKLYRIIEKLVFQTIDLNISIPESQFACREIADDFCDSLINWSSSKSKAWKN